MAKCIIKPVVLGVWLRYACGCIMHILFGILEINCPDHIRVDSEISATLCFLLATRCIMRVYSWPYVVWRGENMLLYTKRDVTLLYDFLNLLPNF